MNRLTPRQHEVVVARCEFGETRDECAYRLGITPSTVRNHSVDIMRRLGLRSFYEVCTEYGRQTADVPLDKP